MAAVDIDQNYTKFCATLGALDEAQSLDYLSRFCLLAMVRHPDPVAVSQMISDAAAIFEAEK